MTVEEASQEVIDFLQHAGISTDIRTKLADAGKAMPDGSFPIRNRSDLQKAIQAYGLAKNKAAAKRWIMKRARELNLTDLLPDSWTTSITQSDISVGDFLEHFGIRGMKWGRRKASTSKANTNDAGGEQRQGMSKKKKAAIAGVVLGASVAAVMLAKNRGSITSMRKSVSTRIGDKAVMSIFSRIGRRSASSVPRTPRRPPEVSASHRAFITKFNKRQTQINRAANEGLRSNDNRLNIPIHARSYLPDWVS